MPKISMLHVSFLVSKPFELEMIFHFIKNIRCKGTTFFDIRKFKYQNMSS